MSNSSKQDFESLMREALRGIYGQEAPRPFFATIPKTSGNMANTSIKRCELCGKLVDDPGRANAGNPDCEYALCPLHGGIAGAALKSDNWDKGVEYAGSSMLSSWVRAEKKRLGLTGELAIMPVGTAIAATEAPTTSKWEPKVGDRVILGRHDNGENWNPSMDQYVGTEATLTSNISENSDPPHRCFRVDTNGWMWRATNMRPAISDEQEAKEAAEMAKNGTVSAQYHKTKLGVEAAKTAQLRVQLDYFQKQYKGLAEQLDAIANKPGAPYATVLSADDKKVVVNFRGTQVEVAPPKKKDGESRQLQPGDTVKVDPQSVQILKVIEDAPNAGEVVVVSRVPPKPLSGPPMCEIDRQGATRAVTYSGLVEEGDRLVLDTSGSVAIANLGKPESAQAVTESTGVTWDDIGGLVDAKREMREAIEAPAKHGDLFAKYGKKQCKGVLLYGAPGCIDGDALVAIHRAGKGFRLPLKEVVRRFNGGTFVGSKGKQVNRTYTWDADIPTMVRCMHNGEFRLRRLVGAYPKGVKKVLKLTLADGKALRLTEDHEVATPGGTWTRADKLVPGTRVLTNGLPAPKSPTQGRYLGPDGYWRITGTIVDKHPYRGKSHSGMPEHRLVAEARANDLSLEAWLAVVATGQFEKRHVFLGPDVEVHHKDEDRTNNAPDNLEVLSKSEHSRAHNFQKHLPVFLPKEVEVLSIEPDGEAEVYDLTVEEAHNFVANGVVVHNCGKTMLGKAAATAHAEVHGAKGAGAFFYVKGPELLNMYVGNTERQIRELFQRARLHKKKNGYPAVIFIDEADAILGKRGSREGFMSSTVVPQFLAEMDGVVESGALVLLSTNRADVLDPAIVRDGRIDRRIRITRPGKEDAKDILSKYLRDLPLSMGVDSAAEVAADSVYDEELRLYTVQRKMGGAARHLTLGHITSGAILAGVVDRATSLAIRRELDGGHGRVVKEDLIAAARLTFEQCKGVNHEDEIAEFVTGWEDEVARVVRVAA